VDFQRSTGEKNQKSAEEIIEDMTFHEKFPLEISD
jgi:hypothetical protein